MIGDGCLHGHIPHSWLPVTSCLSASPGARARAQDCQGRSPCRHYAQGEMPHCMGFGLQGCADACVSASQSLSAPHATTGAVPSPGTAVPSPGGGPSTGGGAPAPSTTTGPRSALKVRCGLVRIYWGHCLPLSCSPHRGLSGFADATACLCRYARGAGKRGACRRRLTG